jgi:hypothetical protein
MCFRSFIMWNLIACIFFSRILTIIIVSLRLFVGEVLLNFSRPIKMYEGELDGWTSVCTRIINDFRLRLAIHCCYKPKDRWTLYVRWRHQSTVGKCSTYVAGLSTLFICLIGNALSLDPELRFTLHCIACVFDGSVNRMNLVACEAAKLTISAVEHHSSTCYRTQV